MKITKNLIRKFAEESIDYVAGDTELEQVLKDCGIYLNDEQLTELGSSSVSADIIDMHNIADDYTDELLEEAETILEKILSM